MKNLLAKLFLILLCLGALPVQAAPAELNRIVAVVNDDVILVSELEDRLRLVKKQLAARKAELPDDDTLRRQVLDRLILERLQLQLADQNNIRVDDETLNASLRNIARENGMTLTEFRKVLERDGQNWARFREDLRNQIRINRLRQQMVGNRINVTDQEIDNLLASQSAWGDQGRQYRLGHILIATPEGASPEQIAETRREAEKVLAELRAGADFARTAIAYSDDRNALEGGDLGWRKAAQLPSLFADVVRKLKPGEVSDLIRSPSGFHIIKLIDIRGDERKVVTQTRVRHILLRPDALQSRDEVLTRLQQLRERIIGGEDFATLARANSQDKLSASRGGDLDWVNPGELVPRFEDAMNRLQPGEISQPVETRFGWHLIQVLDRRTHDNTEDFRRAQARDFIHRRKMDEELELWLRRLRDEAYVEIRLDE
ncbi:peptidylprolyl isomerase [Thiohalobacter sp.]|uniref:peptidylprolyl isomerase n=1 Tax=Thiohalobacter sp. TaxID=2025948 RepID=UPI0026333076|nr:peptidylprolyl isomerase [Thiohalobacter sp.]